MVCAQGRGAQSELRTGAGGESMFALAARAIVGVSLARRDARVTA